MTFLEAAQYAQGAYRPSPGGRYVRDLYDRRRDTRVLCTFVPETQTLVIAFRGTASLRNWWGVNFLVRPREGVHRGIFAAVNVHEKELMKCLVTFPFARLVIVGHSLGGALANEFARRCHDMGYRQTTVVTFGAVRAHRKRWVRMTGMGWRTVQVINNNDVVSRLLGVTYSHIGRLLYFDRHGRHHRHMPLLVRLWDRIAGRLRGGIFDGVTDHGMDDYVRNCAALDMTVESYVDPLHSGRPPKPLDR